MNEKLETFLCIILYGGGQLLAIYIIIILKILGVM